MPLVSASRTGAFCTGIITDYNAEKDEHCITYDFGTDKEEWEWFRFKTAQKSEYQVRPAAHNVTPFFQ